MSRRSPRCRPDARARSAEALDKHRPQIEKWEAFCAEIGEDPAHVGVAWLLHQPAVSAPIIGACTIEQLEGLVDKALTITPRRQAARFARRGYHMIIQAV